MTISYSSFGAAAYSISNPTPDYPASLSANDLILLFVGTKPDTSSCDIDAPGWIELTDASGTGGTGTTGADTGPMRVQTWAKYATGSESGTLTVTNDGSNSVSGAVMLRFTKTSDLWDLQAALGNDTTTGTPFTASATLDLAVGDIVVACGIIPTDITTPTQFSAESFTASGITFDTATEVIELDSSSGNDMGGVIAYAKVTAGSSSSVSTTFSATAGGTTTNVAGPIAFVRLRERAIATGTDGSALREDFESGTLNNPIGTTDGIFDGGGETGSGTQMYYSGVQYHSGSRSAYLDTDGSTGTLWRDIWGPSSDVSRMHFGGYLWVPSGATPTATEPIFVARTDSGNSTARIVLLSGTLTLTTQDGTSGAGDGYTIPTDQWVRWEWDVNPGGGKQRLSLYFGSNLEGNYPNWWEDNTCTSQTTVADLRVGWNTATSSAFYLYFDDLGYSYSNEVGPKLAGPTTYQGTAAFSGASTFTATGTVKTNATAAFSGASTFTATGTVKTNATAAFSGAGSFGSSFSDNALEAEYFYPYEGGSITTSYGIFDGGSDSGGGSWTPDSAHSIIGSQSGKLYLPSGTQSYRLIDTGTVTKLYVRTYVWVSSVDIAGSNFNMLQVDDSSGTRVARLVVTTAEEMRQQDDSTGVGSTWAFLFDQWVRVEWFLDSDNNTQTFRVFHGSNLHGTTPDTEISSTFTTGSDIKYLRIGPSVGSMTNALTAWYDAVGYRTSDWTGPSIEGTGPIGSVYPPTTIHNGSASFSGDSSISSSGAVTYQASINFRADSDIFITSIRKQFGDASLSGQSNITIDVGGIVNSSISFSGNATLSVIPTVSIFGAAEFSGYSSIDVASTLKAYGISTFSADSNIYANSSLKKLATIAFSGDSSIEASSTVKTFSLANFDAISTLYADAELINSLYLGVFGIPIQ